MSLKLSFIPKKKVHLLTLFLISGGVSWWQQPGHLSFHPFISVNVSHIFHSSLRNALWCMVLSFLISFAFTLFTTTLHCLLYLITLTKWLWNQTSSLKHLWQSSFLNHNSHLVSIQSIIFKAWCLLDKQ